MKERVRNLRLVTLNLDYDDVKEFKEIIGKDFSKAVRDMIRQELDNQKKVVGQNLPILNCQATIDQYVPILYKNDHEKKQMFDFIQQCDEKNLTILAVQVNEARKGIEKRRAVGKSKPFRFGNNF